MCAKALKNIKFQSFYSNFAMRGAALACTVLACTGEHTLPTGLKNYFPLRYLFLTLHVKHMIDKLVRDQFLNETIKIAIFRSN